MKKKIPYALIVEDDVAVAEIFTLVLQEAGYITETVYDGAQAIGRLAVAAPDLVTLDLNLPHLSGKDVLKNIRTDERLAHTQVMLVTANTVLADMLGEESDLVLLKPVSATQLRELAERLRLQAD